jgi:alpha-beta hydrolase superfamily lysophospholipase
MPQGQPGKYAPDAIGDWGVPVAAAGGRYDTETLSLPGGGTLFLRSWRAADPSAPVLVVLHGLGAHSGWFIDMANELHAHGLNVYAPDHRGFGRSEGPRGHVRRASDFLADIGALLDEVGKRHPSAPLVVLGHSLGGLFAIYLAAADARRKPPRLAGVILLNPGMAVAWKVPVGRQLRITVGGLRGSRRPWSVAPGAEAMTTNAEAAEMLAADTYWVRQQTARFLYQAELMRMGAMKRAGAVRAPALVIQSEADKSVVPAASKRCFERLGSKDKAFKTYPGFSHDLEFEPERAALDDDIAQWVLAHAAKPQG